jgi:hypothetical protein
VQPAGKAAVRVIRHQYSADVSASGYVIVQNIVH